MSSRNSTIMDRAMAKFSTGDDNFSETTDLHSLLGSDPKPGSFRDRYALSEQGFKALISGAVWSMIGNFSLMLPIGVIYLVTSEFVAHLTDPTQPLPNIWKYLGLIALVLVLMFAAQWMEYSKTYNVVYAESARTRIGLAEKLRMLPMSFFGKRDTADLTTAVLTDCANVEQVFSHIMPELIGSIASTAVVTVVLFFYSWQLALAVIWVVPLCFLLLWATRKIQTRYGVTFNNRRLNVASGIQECLECMPEIRASGQSERYLTGLDDKIDLAEKAQIASELVPGTIVSSASMFLNVGKATTILVGASLVASGQIGFMTYLLFLLAASMIYTPLSTTFESTAELLSIGTHTARLREIRNEPVQQGSEDFAPQGHTIEFDNVTFSYGSSADGQTGNQAGNQSDGAAADAAGTVLDGVSFTAREGEVTALVGPSGGGKSTVSKLAARFWDADGGTVRVGGVDVAGVAPEALLRDYAMVFQDVVLFNDTVLENIRIGRRDATDADVLTAARAANCDEFVTQLPQQYNTEIGENGATLSGGERQRISIARALLKNAPIVLLDEATASLDAENETRVQGALSRLLTGKTVLVIAHRMRTVAHADKVIVLDGGHVAEEGAPAELMAQGGRFAHMVQLQTQSQNWTLR
jgi:ATP-binding cassette subfamily B protein